VAFLLVRYDYVYLGYIRRFWDLGFYGASGKFTVVNSNSSSFFNCMRFLFCILDSLWLIFFSSPWVFRFHWFVTCCNLRFNFRLVQLNQYTSIIHGEVDSGRHTSILNSAELLAVQVGSWISLKFVILISGLIS